MCTTKQKLIEKGIPYEDVMERFVNDEKFYFDFLHQFTQDEQITLLTQALKEKQPEKAFQAAHTLKGLMGNLGLLPLVETISPLVETLRTGSLTGTDTLFSSFEQAHREFCQFIEENIPQ